MKKEYTIRNNLTPLCLHIVLLTFPACLVWNGKEWWWLVKRTLEKFTR